MLSPFPQIPSKSERSWQSPGDRGLSRFRADEYQLHREVVAYNFDIQRSHRLNEETQRERNFLQGILVSRTASLEDSWQLYRYR
jgi:hypothetical protein